jgi:hypothetical protein
VPISLEIINYCDTGIFLESCALKQKVSYTTIDRYILIF